MTLQTAGSLGGRRFAPRRDPETGTVTRFVCVKCQVETEPTAEAFVQHVCEEPTSTPKPRRARAAQPESEE